LLSLNRSQARACGNASEIPIEAKLVLKISHKR
jgi:hypothetical protein